MKHFKLNFSIFFSVFILFFSFGFVKTIEAQVSTDPLYISNVYDFEAYPMYQGTAPNGQAGICLLASFGASQTTSIQARVAPFATFNNPTWEYVPSVIQIDPPTEGLNMSFANAVDPNIEYIIQFVEIAEDGTKHLITPSNVTDDVRFMCTPNQDGTLGSSCPSEAFLVSDCTPAGVLDASSNQEMIQNIQSQEASISFDIITTSLTPGQNITVAYATESTPITSGTFAGMQTLTFPISAQSPLSVTLTSLQQNTTYYVTILDQGESIVLTTSNGVGYKAMSTGAPSNDDEEQVTTSTINVNINGTFGQAELEGENIEQGFTQCGYGETYDCDFNQLLATIDRVIKFALYIIILPLAAILFAWSGIKLIIAKSQGKQAALSDAKSMFWRVLLGLVFAMGAWVIVKFVLVILGYSDASGVLSQILGITTTQ